MDEEKKGFPIPANKPIFGGEGDVSIEARPMPQSDFIMSFANDDGTKAVVLTSVETANGEVLERHGRAELEGYAKTLLETGDDPFELQIGKTFNGETAGADAQAEAFRLSDEYDPGSDATDEELVAAVDEAKADVETGEAEEDLEEGLEAEEEPMLAQLKDVGA